MSFHDGHQLIQTPIHTIVEGTQAINSGKQFDGDVESLCVLIVQDIEDFGGSKKAQVIKLSIGVGTGGGSQ
eukprot:10958921-Ditylum_brightwellii.AAC.1